MAVARVPLPPSRPPPVSAGASRWEELAIDYETPPADSSLPRGRTCMSGRGRAGEGATMGGWAYTRAHDVLAVNPPSRRLAWTRFFDGGAGD